MSNSDTDNMDPFFKLSNVLNVEKNRPRLFPLDSTSPLGNKIPKFSTIRSVLKTSVDITGYSKRKETCPTSSSRNDLFLWHVLFYFFQLHEVEKQTCRTVHGSSIVRSTSVTSSLSIFINMRTIVLIITVADCCGKTETKTSICAQAAVF
jgi:hypothetical protein